MTRFLNLIRQNLLVILFGCLIFFQLLTWRALVGIAQNVDHYICGTRGVPCKVVVLPDR